MKILHVSDTHIGCEIPVEYKNIRKNDFLNAFKQVIEFSIKEKVDLIIHSGDLLDDYFRMNTKTFIDLLDLLFKLRENNIPFIFIKGNHDVKGQKNATIDILKKLGLVIEAGKDPLVYKDIYIYGISEPANYSGDELRIFYEEYLKRIKIQKNGYTIFMFHGSSNIFNELYNLEYDKYRIVPNNILPDADYYAFGHFHIHLLKNTDGKIYAIPGSTERTEISKIEEKDRKGFYLWEDGNIKFVEIKTRPIFIYESSVEKEEDLNKIREVINNKSKETLIKLRLRYDRNLYQIIRSFIDNLIKDNYLIIDELYTEESEEIFEEKEINVEDYFKKGFYTNQEEIMELYNKLRKLFDEYYSEDEENIERIKDLFYKELI